MNHQIPEGSDTVIRSCCKTMNVSDTPFLDAWAMKKEGHKFSLEGLYALISGYMSTLEDISNKIDAMKAEGGL